MENNIENFETTKNILESEVLKIETKKPCNTCRKRGLLNSHWTMMIVSFYILFAAIYGTITLFKDVLSLF